MDYECSLSGELDAKNEDYLVTVKVPVTSLCPCSKEISDYGAHNQRGYLTIEIRTTTSDNGTPKTIWIEDIIEIAESSASCPIYPLLKRPDERHITMQAYDNPVFVTMKGCALLGAMRRGTGAAPSGVPPVLLLE